MREIEMLAEQQKRPFPSEVAAAFDGYVNTGLGNVESARAFIAALLGSDETLPLLLALIEDQDVVDPLQYYEQNVFGDGSESARKRMDNVIIQVIYRKLEEEFILPTV